MRRREWQQIRKQGHIQRLGPWIVLSLLIWSFMLYELRDIWQEPDPSMTKTPVAMRSYSARQWMQNKSVKQAKKPQRIHQKRDQEPEKEKPKPKVAEKPKGQIVDIAMPEKQETPEEAKFVSQYDSKVKKQTKAKIRKPDDTVAPKISKKGMKQPAQRMGRKEDRLVISPEARDSPAKSEKKASFKLPKLKMASRLKLDIDGDRGHFKNREKQERNLKGNSDRLEMIFEESARKAGGQPGTNHPNNIPESLLPDMNNSLEVAGSPMNDYLHDVDEGDATWLNTKGFKYATFYNRVKRKVSQRWNPVEAQRRYDPTFAIYGYQNRYTVLHITLDANGNLESAEIGRSSGVDFLDQEALSAVIQAAPFPNPPEGILETDGKIKFPFGFHFELSREGIGFRGFKN